MPGHYHAVSEEKHENLKYDSEYPGPGLNPEPSQKEINVLTS